MTITKFDTEEAWLRARRRQDRVTASEVAAVLTGRLDPLMLWAYKLGRAELPPFPPLLAAVGKALQPLIVEAVLARRGEVPPATELLIVDSGRHLTCSPDCLLPGAPPLLLECKSLDRVAIQKIATGPEAYAWLQVHASCLCFPPPAPRLLIAYLVGNGMGGDGDLKIFEVSPDAEALEAIEAWASDFVASVRADRPPDPQGGDGVTALLAKLFPPAKPRRQGLLPAEPWREAFRQHATLTRAIAQMERDRLTISQKIHLEMSQRGIEEATVAATADDGITYRAVRAVDGKLRIT